MADSTLNSLAGIYSRLSSFTELTDIVSTRIYSDVPQQQTFPFVYFMIESSDDFSSKNRSDYTHRVRAHGFSQDQSPAEALQIREAVFNALDRQEDDVTVTGCTVVRLQKSELATCLKEDDGVTWQSVIEFDMTVQTN